LPSNAAAWPSSTPSGVGTKFSGATTTRSANPPIIVNADTRWPGLMTDSYGAERTTPAISMPGTKRRIQPQLVFAAQEQ